MLDGTIAFFSPCLGDDAEVATHIASLHDGDEGGDRGREGDEDGDGIGTGDGNRTYCCLTGNQGPMFSERFAEGF